MGFSSIKRFRQFIIDSLDGEIFAYGRFYSEQRGFQWKMAQGVNFGPMSG